MNFAEPYILFFCAAFLLLIIEVLLGMTFGVALAGAITFFALGVLEVMSILNGLNQYLFSGSVIFVFSTFSILKFLRTFRGDGGTKDVNDY